MKYGRVLTYKDAEEAKDLIGKKVAFGDTLFYIEEFPQERTTARLEGINQYVGYPFITGNGEHQFIREIIEEEPELMTNRQLAEWLAKGNGEHTHKNTDMSYTAYGYYKSEENDPVSDKIRIRSWDSEEWVIPTVDIYERDCKGGSK